MESFRHVNGDFVNTELAMNDTMPHTNITLERISREIDQLPLLPGVLFELMKSDPEDENFYDHMLSLSRSDPPLATFILSYANSAAYNRRGRIDDLQTALSRVGSQTILELLLALSVAKVFVPHRETQKAIWLHSLEVANIGSFVASTMQTTLKPSSAYLCGLLHDIGRFVLFQLAPDALNDTDAQGWSSPTELVHVEEEMVGFNHARVGYLTCQRLKLPAQVTNLIRYHHHYAAVSHPKVPQELKDCLLIVQFADDLSVLTEVHAEWKDWSPRELERQILEHCTHQDWGTQTLPVREVAEQLPTLLETAAKSCKALGL